MATEARVPVVDPESVTGETRRIFEGALRLRGRVANSSRVWVGHVPYIGKFQVPSSVPIQLEGAGAVLPVDIKVVAILKTSRINSCAY
jgi:hypothetical protein